MGLTSLEAEEAPVAKTAEVSVEVPPTVTVAVVVEVVGVMRAEVSER